MTEQVSFSTPQEIQEILRSKKRERHKTITDDDFLRGNTTI